MEDRPYILEFFDRLADIEVQVNLKQLVEQISGIVNIGSEEILEMISHCPGIPQTDTDKFLFRHRKPFWDYSLAWVIKHRTLVFQNNQFPFTEPELKKVETFGNYLNSLLELCYRSIDLANDVGFRRNNQMNAISLWNSVWGEIMLASMVRPTKISITIGLFHGASTKEELSKNIQKEIKMLRMRQNPYLPITQLGILIDMCLKISEASPKDSNIIKSKKSQFRNGAWKGFIDSYDRIDLKTLVDGVYSVHIDDEKIYFNEGGRHKTLVYPPQQGFLRQSRQAKKL